MKRIILLTIAVLMFTACVPDREPSKKTLIKRSERQIRACERQIDQDLLRLKESRKDLEGEKRDLEKLKKEKQ